MIKILIAEDDYRVAEIHEQFLNQISGIELIGKTRDASATLEILHQKDVELLLLDIYLPDELGTSLIPKLRKIKPDMDIIMITAGTDRRLLEESIRQGVFYYMIKPLKASKFVNVIQDYIEKRRLLKEHKKISQSLVDAYFSDKKKQKDIQEDVQETLPKGIDLLTLKKVKNIIKEERQGITAELMGEKMGASRTTARRYLEYLMSTGNIAADIEYGVIGRSERKYFKR